VKRQNYQSELSQQMQEQRQRKDQEKYKEKTIVDQGFDFECYNRDRLVAEDKRKMQGFLQEQMKEQQLNRAYEGMDSSRQTTNNAQERMHEEQTQYRMRQDQKKSAYQSELRNQMNEKQQHKR